jgi:hypothetical protein
MGDCLSVRETPCGASALDGDNTALFGWCRTGSQQEFRYLALNVVVSKLCRAEEQLKMGVLRCGCGGELCYLVLLVTRRCG